MTVVYQAFQLATDVTGLQKAIANGKVASMLGVEGYVSNSRCDYHVTKQQGSRHKFCQRSRARNLTLIFHFMNSAHQLGNSLGVLRTYHTLGVRYVTLTHSCHNAFADSAGILVSPEPKHGGLR
jgi:membrane dipeptidase